MTTTDHALSAHVERIAAPSGNRDNDYFKAVCRCGWSGPPNSNRSAEGRRLAQRDADQHRCAKVDAE